MLTCFRVLAVVLLTLACVGCGDGFDLVGWDRDRLLQTPELEYTLTSTERGLETQIPFSYTNATTKTVYLVNCRGNVSPALEKLEGDHWVGAWSAIVNRCLSPPVVIARGETYVDTLHVFAGRSGSHASPKFQVAEVPGTYRVVWYGVVHDYDDSRAGFGEVLPKNQRVSNSFSLRVQ